MIVTDIMTRHVHTCRIDDTLDRAARLMWDYDCGAIPVIDRYGHIIGMITDRDICMAAFIQGRRLQEIRVIVAGSHHIQFVSPDAPIECACEIMKTHRVRRLPVIDIGGNLVGIVSVADIVRSACRPRDPDDSLDVERVVSMLADVYRPSRPKAASSEDACEPAAGAAAE